MRQRNVKNKQEIIQNSKYFINNPNEYKGSWNKVFNNNNPIHVEIGMGKGQFIINNAIKYPNINFIGIEKYDSILALALKKIPDGLKNLKIIRLDAKLINDIFTNEIDLIYLNFSDPWPKKRHEKRRLTSYNFLEKYDSIFKNKCHIKIKTDNQELFVYSIKTLNNYNYKIQDLTFNLEKRSDLENIMTEYEEKFTKLNNQIYMIEVFK